MSARRVAVAVAGALLLGTVMVGAEEPAKPAPPFEEEAPPAPSTSYTPPPPPGPLVTESEPLHPSETFDTKKPEKQKKPKEPGFSDGAGLVVSIEQLFGVMENRFEEGERGNGVTFGHQGAFPAITGPRIGLHGVTKNGVTFGVSVGAWAGKLFESDEKATKVLTIAPRIGLIGSFERRFGYWVRTGVNFLDLVLAGDDELRAFELAIETYFIWSPIDHVAIFMGPHLETTITGTSIRERASSRKFHHRSVGFMSGLGFDF